MLTIYNAKMTPLYKEDKKIAHEQALWHKVVAGIVFNKKMNTVYFQTIYPKASYTFERPDYIDFSIGGHIEDDETTQEAIVREAKEELALSEFTPHFLGIRVCNCDPSPTYRIREFQYFYGIETTKTLQEMTFLQSDNEVKSVIEIKLEEFLDILLKIKPSAQANEMTLDRQTRNGTYTPNITLTADRIVPDYYKDKSILEKFLAVKTLMEEK